MQVTRLFDLLDYCREKYPETPDALCGKENGVWRKYNMQEFVGTCKDFSYGLLSLGVQKDDKITIMANNRPEWNISDFGIQMSGATSVPLYPTLSETDLKFILNDAEVKYLFVSDEALYQKVKKVSAEVPSVKGIYTFNKVAGANHWSEVLELGKKNPNAEKVKAICDSVKETDMVTILYTSGTTGVPKGVMLSHKNIVSNVMVAKDLTPVVHPSRVLSFLPLNHVYERMLTYVYMYMGASIYYAESMETIGDNIREVKPDVFSAVPRLVEKVYDKILAKGNELTGIKRKLFFWALSLGERFDINGKNGWWYDFQLMLANKIIFSKWREGLGGNVKAMVSGSAPLQARLIKIFYAAGIPVLEGYGLTETSPVVSVNQFDGGTKFGTVGPVLKGIQVKIAEDGEILVKGPNVMLGYYKRPDLTAEVIDKDGWFHTGDIGIFEEGKFLKITDRKKEIFKTSGGKYIAPQMIENKLKESPFIEQALVVGESQKYAAALIVPAFAHIKDWLAKQGVTEVTTEQIIKNPKVIGAIQEAVDEKNKSLGNWETIKKFELLPREWTIDRGEMTPTLKLKRKVVTEANKQLIEKMFV